VKYRQQLPMLTMGQTTPPQNCPFSWVISSPSESATNIASRSIELFFAQHFRVTTKRIDNHTDRQITQTDNHTGRQPHRQTNTQTQPHRQTKQAT